MKKFDTCFFERYARQTLTTLLGEKYATLVNRDRPDLQMEDKSLGIEVTRAMEPRKEAADDMLKEMAGLEVPEKDSEEIGQILKSGYAYGLQEGRYIGHLEREYWSLALPLRRIIASKIGKVGSGFYGEFKEFGLYIFCKDNLTEEEVILTMEYASELQRNLDVKYSTIYLALADCLWVCDLAAVDHLGQSNHINQSGHLDLKSTCTSHPITTDMRRWFFMEALEK